MNRIDRPINAIQNVKTLRLEQLDSRLGGGKLGAQLVSFTLKLLQRIHW